MNVAIAGAHGKIALRLIPKLVAEGHTVVGLIRNPAHARELEELGADAVLCDLEVASVQEITEAITRCDAAVFAAGAGAGSTAERKWTVDRDGAVKLVDAAHAAWVDRVVIVSAVGAEAPPAGDDVFSVYLRAKAEADAATQQSDRRWTIVRPGALTDEPGTGCARIDTEPYRGQVTRDDVAAVIAAVLADPASEQRILYVNGGDQPIATALTAAVGAAA